MKRLTAILVIALVSIFGAAACGGGEDQQLEERLNNRANQLQQQVDELQQQVDQLQNEQTTVGETTVGQPPVGETTVGQ